ncbi:MAG: molybdopterin-dependent oxidoreductase [Georgfuchsia sp.]
MMPRYESQATEHAVASPANHREAISFCRICSGGCGVRLRIDAQNKIVDIRGDKENTLTNGYACFKGLQAGEAHHRSNRLLKAQKRQPDGSFTAIPLQQALDEIAARIATLIEEQGPDSVALFCGNGAMAITPAFAMYHGFLAALGSRQYFSTLTIDQSAKMVSYGRLGAWAGGLLELEQMDVALIFGANPLVAHAASGILAMDPVRSLKRAKARGLKFIVVDPRKTETANFADLHLQPYPGQDAAIAAGLIRLILEEGWEDKKFCARFVGADRMAQLRAAVAPFTPEMVESRAGLPSGQIRSVAEMFARDGRVGVAYGGTGPDMAAFSNLAQHLIDDLNVICGRFPRAGDKVLRTNMQAPAMTPRAEVVPPCRLWEQEPPSRIRGVGSLFGERLSGTLADEILTPGAGQIRALIVDGGNPALSLPDQSKAVEALQSLDLLVSIEPWMTATARLAHYILPTPLQYEREDVNFFIPGFDFWPGAWLQHTPAIIPPPIGSELAEDWYILWAIAKRLGKTIVYAGKRALDFDVAPTTAELLDIRLEGSQVSLDDLKEYPHGREFDIDLGTVAEASPGAEGRFDVMPADVAGELADFLDRMNENGQMRRDGRNYGFLMTTRRLRDLFNSNGTQVDSIRKRVPYNAAYLNSADMKALQVADGDLIEISSSHGRSLFVAACDDHVRQGVVSTTHGFGNLPGPIQDPKRSGTCVNLLIDSDRHFEAINAMPHFSGVPVDIAKVITPTPLCQETYPK